jgi:hypothetical protein
LLETSDDHPLDRNFYGDSGIIFGYLFPVLVFPGLFMEDIRLGLLIIIGVTNFKEKREARWIKFYSPSLKSFVSNFCYINN